MKSRAGGRRGIEEEVHSYNGRQARDLIMLQARTVWMGSVDFKVQPMMP